MKPRAVTESREQGAREAPGERAAQSNATRRVYLPIARLHSGADERKTVHEPERTKAPVNQTLGMAVPTGSAGPPRHAGRRALAAASKQCRGASGALSASWTTRGV